VAIKEAARNVGESSRRNRLEQNRRTHLKTQNRVVNGIRSCVGNTRSEEKNTVFYSDLAHKWNILEPINGISSEI